MTRLRAAMRSVGVAQRAAQKSRTDAAGGASPAAVPAAVPAASNQPAATMVEGSAPPTAAPLQAMAQPPPAAYMASPAVVPGSSNNFGKVLSSVGTGAAPTPVSYQYNVGQSQNKIGGAVTGKASSMLPLTALGFTWALVYIKSRNLLVTVMIHGMWNSRVFIGSLLGL